MHLLDNCTIPICSNFSVYGVVMRGAKFRRSICGIIGHRRDKLARRRYHETWRSVCTSCGVDLVRDEFGRWQPGPVVVPEVPQSWRSERLGPREPNLLVVDEMPPIADLPFAAGLVESIPTHRGRTEDDTAYYLARAVECRKRAEQAEIPSIELIHLDLAIRYEILARTEESQSSKIKISKLIRKK